MLRRGGPRDSAYSDDGSENEAGMHGIYWEWLSDIEDIVEVILMVPNFCFVETISENIVNEDG